MLLINNYICRFNAVVKRIPLLNLQKTDQVYTTSSQQNNVNDRRGSDVHSRSGTDNFLSNTNSEALKYTITNNTTTTSIGYTINHSVPKRNNVR